MILRETSSASGSVSSSVHSTPTRPAIGNGVAQKIKSTAPDEGPLADSQDDGILLASAQGGTQINIPNDNTRALRSEDLAPEQHPSFWTFVRGFSDYYNQESAEFIGLETSLHPLFTRNSTTSEFIVKEDQMTIRNRDAVNKLMDDMNKKSTIIFNTKNIQAILKRFRKL